jgi:bacillopeptidase F
MSGAESRQRRSDVASRIRTDGEHQIRSVVSRLVDLVDAGSVELRESFPVAGVVVLRGDAGAVEHIAALPEVVAIRADRVRRIPAHISAPHLSSIEAPGTSWNLEMIKSPASWRAGSYGDGSVVATIDTGLDWTHSSLEDKYRGRDGDHSYDWFDVTENGRPLRYPSDPNGRNAHCWIVGR